ncbi:P-loop containing nucleoside triphosphate hydrolase protein [Amylocystis lapponica]|nr:P-loop containing nucleoside triphosphate hydrolase protein [Amylocystis lapponica]
MSLLASSRAALRYAPLLPPELLASCLHTSSPVLLPKPRSRKGASGSRTPPRAAAPSRTRLVKDLAPRTSSSSKEKLGKLEVAPKPDRPARDPAPHPEARDWFHGKSSQPRRRQLSHSSRDAPPGEARGRWNRETKSNASEKGEIPNFDNLSRTSREQPPNTRPSTERSPSGEPQPDTTTPRKQIYNPLSDEFDISARAVSTRELPSAFASPPLMPGLLASVTSVLGPHAKPTPIQALSLKHLFTPPASASADDVAAAPSWHQCLLAAETGSGKSIAYLLPMLQDLKRTELDPASTPAPASSARLPSPRALVLAPTHELARQLSGFAKALVHEVKLRVLCASQANLPSTSRGSATASKMARDFAEFAEGGELLVRRAQARPLDVVVGTPTKVLEMVKGHGWNHEQPKVEDMWERDPGAPRPRKWTVGKPEMGLERVEWVVVDEADVLFDPDFQESTRRLLAEISKARGQPVSFDSELKDNAPATPLDYPFHLLLTTATIPAALASYLDTHHPSLVRLASPHLHHLPSTLRTEYSSWSGGRRDADIEQRLRHVWYEDLATGDGRKSKVLIFCNKSTRVEALGAFLREKGVANVALTSTSDTRRRGSNHHLDGFLRTRGAAEELPPLGASEAEGSAESAMEDVKDVPHVMITTSLLSRGLDFSPAIKHVFIVDEPRNMVDFLHRAGRSGRAGERGKVVVFGKTKGRGSLKMKDMRKKVGALAA